MLAEALLVTLSVQYGASTRDCLGEAELRGEVEKRLKRRVFVEPRRAALKVDVAFARRGAQIEARITLASADGTPRGARALATEGHCSRLDDSLALSVALLVDQPPEPEPSPGPPASASAPAAPESPPAASPALPATLTTIAIPREVDAPREPWHVQVGAALVTAFRILPQLEPAGSLRVSVLPSHFAAVTLSGEAFRSATAERDASSGARFRLLRVGLSLCEALAAGASVQGGVCVGQKLSWIDVQGFGFDHDGHHEVLGFALTAGGEGRVRLAAPVWLRGYVGVEAPLVRDTFYAGGASKTRLFRASPAALAAEIGVEVELW